MNHALDLRALTLLPISCPVGSRENWRESMRLGISHITIQERPISHEPLVRCAELGLMGHDYYHAMAQGRHTHDPALQREVQHHVTPQIWLRRSIAVDLHLVDSAIAPHGIRLFLLSGYRSPGLQRLARRLAILDHDQEFADRMLSDPDVYLPHATGAAFDIELWDVRAQCLLPTKIPTHCEREHLERTASLSVHEQAVKRNRRLIHNLLTTEAVLPAGRTFIPHPLEYWHYGRNEKLSTYLAGLRGVEHPSLYSELTSLCGPTKEIK